MSNELDFSGTSKGQLKYSPKIDALKPTDQNSIFGISLSSPFPSNFSNYYTKEQQPFTTTTGSKKKKQNKYVLSSESESESEEEEEDTSEYTKPALEIPTTSKLKIQTKFLNDFETQRKLIVQKKIEEKRKALEKQLKERYSKSEKKLNEILNQSAKEKEKKIEIFSKLHQQV